MRIVVRFVLLFLLLLSSFLLLLSLLLLGVVVVVAIVEMMDTASVIPYIFCKSNMAIWRVMWDKAFFLCFAFQMTPNQTVASNFATQRFIFETPHRKWSVHPN